MGGEGRCLLSARRSSRADAMRAAIVSLVALAAAVLSAAASPAPLAVKVLDPSFKGVYSPAAGETVTASGPLSYVSIRVTAADVTIQGIDFLNATQDRSRPATIDASGATNTKIVNVTIHGDGTQQNQGIYQQSGTGLVISGGSCIDPGMDRYFDHCLYVNGAKNFLVDGWTCRAAHGACIHAYSGGATGTVRNSDLGKAAWNVVSWGSGNDIVLENDRLHDAYQVENGRGYAIEAASSGKVTVRNTASWNAQTAGNVAGHSGWNTQGGGTIVDGGGNTFVAPAPPSPPPAPAPPPPPSPAPPPAPPAGCDFAGLDAKIAAVADANTRAALTDIRQRLSKIQNCG